MSRRICVITGTRAEYGLLSLLMKKIHGDSSFELQVVVTGMHLSPNSVPLIGVLRVTVLALIVRLKCY